MFWALEDKIAITWEIQMVFSWSDGEWGLGKGLKLKCIQDPEVNFNKWKRVNYKTVKRDWLSN